MNYRLISQCQEDAQAELFCVMIALMSSVTESVLARVRLVNFREIIQDSYCVATSYLDVGGTPNLVRSIALVTAILSHLSLRNSMALAKSYSK
jgi:hypothetical protein